MSAAVSSRSRCLLAPARFLPSLGRFLGRHAFRSRARVSQGGFPRRHPSRPCASFPRRHPGLPAFPRGISDHRRLGSRSVISTDSRAGFSADSSARSPKGHSARPVESVSLGRRRFEPASEAVLMPAHRADFRGGIATDPSSGPLLFDAVPSGFFPRARPIRRFPERVFPTARPIRRKSGDSCKKSRL